MTPRTLPNSHRQESRPPAPRPRLQRPQTGPDSSDSPPRGSQRYLFLTPQQWIGAVTFSFLVGVVTALCSYQISLWIAVTMFLAVLTFCHMFFASRWILVLPHLFILIAALQYVLAAWLNYDFPPKETLMDIGNRIDIYLAYAGPVLVAVIVGFAVILVRLPVQRSVPPQPNARLLRELDILFVGGLFALFFGHFVPIASVGFVLLLISNLRYVAVFGRMLVKGSGWHWRLALVLIIEGIFATTSTMFHDFLLWSLWTFAIGIYYFRPSARTIFVMVATALLALPALQVAKWDMRSHALEEMPDPTRHSVLDRFRPEQAETWITYFGAALKKIVTLDVDTGFFADMAPRFNQGWIINRVMFTVPEHEPYARGETLKDAVVYTVIPRMFSPDKDISDGHANMKRFADVQLSDQTSMNLGFAGEMYANFGAVGGVVGCACYALVIGFFFRMVCCQAFIRPLWWAILPYIFYTTLNAEGDIADMLSWTIKAYLVFLLASLVLPAFRQALYGSKVRPKFKPVLGLAPKGD